MKGSLMTLGQSMATVIMMMMLMTLGQSTVISIKDLVGNKVDDDVMKEVLIY